MAVKSIQRDADTAYKLPPQNIEAEESLLSAILLDDSTLIDVVEILSPEDFYSTSHQKIYEAVVDLFSKNEPVDLITLSNRLTEKGLLDEVGGKGHRGITYISWLTDAAPAAVNAPHYARIVRDRASLRRLIQKANEITRRCYDAQGDVDDIINFAESSIFEISEDKIHPAFFPISKLIESNIDALEERQGNKTLITGVPTGFTRLDHLTSGFQPSDLIILAARPSMGKTAFALNVARNAAVDGNVPVAIFSLEMSKEQLSMRLLCAEARVDSSRIRSGYFSRDDWDALTEAAGVLSEAPIYIDDSADITAIEIRAKSRRLKMEKNLGLVIVDYLQLMKGRSSLERRDLEISEISRSLKSLAKELEVPVIALSQLNRKLEERSDKRPMLSDLRESGSIEQDADVVAFIYRDEVYNREENNPNRGKAEIILGKQRNGPIGSASLVFLNTYTRFENPAPDDMAGIGRS
ncbi:replicative DNA helicase [Desulfococcus sp.]|uniref:replicative DNA helicase n=1 Tax=Desulfococcus sp. TaxID=2025834 RepID=UPI003593AFBE